MRLYELSLITAIEIARLFGAFKHIAGCKFDAALHAENASQAWFAFGASQ
jgi:hypothetical protein